MLANRRRYPRAALGSRCWCETDGITLYARAMNVSEGGLFIRTYAPLQRGSPARLRFPVDKGGEVAADAVVVWVREPAEPEHVVPGMGLQFTTIDEASLAAIRDFIARADDTRSFWPA
ncbi:MAG TPA: TIGR02266 family protein [Myxococcales bacterium]|nr:TIGR02266 family protein [Myxococcales bacterium]